MDLFEKPGDALYRLSQVAMLESFLAFREDLTLMTAAARMVNLVAAIVAEGDPDPRMFEALEQGLRSLVATRDPGLTVLLFQIRVLGVCGFQTFRRSTVRRAVESVPRRYHNFLLRRVGWSVMSVFAGKLLSAFHYHGEVWPSCSKHFN